MESSAAASDVVRESTQSNGGLKAASHHYSYQLQNCNNNGNDEHGSWIICCEVVRCRQTTLKQTRGPLDW